MAENKDIDQSSKNKLEEDLKAIEEQALLYAQDLARVFMERKEKERQLELTKQQLARSARIALLGEMAASIAHEMNNTLTPAMGHLSVLLLDRKSHSEKTIDRLELVEQSLAKAAAMLQQVLDFSRKRPEKREPVDIQAILDQSLSLLRPKFMRSKIEVKKELQPDLPKLRVDNAQIEQVFTNLSLNAIDAMDPGGTLRIAATHHLEKSARNKPYMEIMFEDTGCGISPEISEHIFEPFFTTKAGQGTGLGLFISYGIIEKHGGTIDLETTSGTGTQFKIRLPAA
ncbi:MAG: ATP-binding protein [Thermodesulfobacteriota bacterium]|nr:ATP-binding protein [Thermodesulfobacteriota bacterium]